MELIYTVGLDTDEPIMLIDKHIGYDEEDGVGIMGDQFQKELLFLDTLNKKRIQVWINSVGGNVMDAYPMYNAILKTKTRVDTYCYGIAASSAGVVFTAGKTRTMADYALFMMHSPEHGDMESLLKIQGSLAKMIAERSQLDETVVAKLMDQTTWMTADECKMTGICNEVQMSADQNKPRLKQMEAKAAWKEANKVVNVLKPQKTSKMKKIANKLGLNEEAAEDVIATEIDSIKNKLKKSEGDVTTLSAEIETLKTAKNALQVELDAEKQKVEDEKKALVKAKAEVMVTDFAKAGKIKNEATVIASWTDKAILDFDGVKKMIEELPVNKTAPDFAGATDKTVIPITAAGVMAKISQEKNK